MKICKECSLSKDDSYFLKSEDMCKTCLRKQVKFIKLCNKCKCKKEVIKFGSGSKICTDCIERECQEILDNKRYCVKCSYVSDLSQYRAGDRICRKCKNKQRYKRVSDGVSKKYPTTKESTKRWRENNKDYLRKYRNKYSLEKYNTDLKYKLSVICRSFLRRCLYSKSKGERTKDVLMYNTDKLKQRLEYQFTREMNWSNYGSYWNIDHRKPISHFKVGTPIYVINSLINLKPVVKEFNYSKQDRFIS